ncbi:MAG: hypothetical protein R3F56_23070 [Planctomycetota bacterium]
MGGPEMVDLAARYLDDADVFAQAHAWRLVLDNPQPGESERLLQGLEHRNYYVRACAARVAGASPCANAATDRQLEQILAEDPDQATVEHAATSLARRHGEAGAERAWDILEQRGETWLACATTALTLRPDARFEEVYAALAQESDEDLAIVGSRALAALRGSSDEDAALQMHPARMTSEEFAEHWSAQRRQRTGLALSSWTALMQEASRSRVVVLGESHGSMYERGMQTSMLMELMANWDDTPVLICETPVRELQKVVEVAAIQLGCPVEVVENTEARRRSGHARDEEAKQNLLRRVTDEPQRRFVVIYGDGHRDSLVGHLRANGVPATGVSLIGFGGMRVAAWRAVDSLATRGLVFRYPDGTFYVPTNPLGASSGCPQIDAEIDRMARAGADDAATGTRSVAEGLARGRRAP